MRRGGWATAGTMRGRSASFFPVEPNSVKLHPVVHQPITELFGNLALQSFKLGIDEFNDLAGLHIYQMIVMRLWRGFIACAPVTKVMSVKNARFFKQAHGSIDCSDGDLGIDRRSAFVQLFHVGVIVTIAQDSHDDASLVGYPQAAFGAKCF